MARSPTERIDAVLKKRGLAPPSGFAPQPGPIHANLQRVFACDLLRDGPLKGSFPGGWDIWLYTPYLGEIRGRKRRWAALGDHDGGNYTVFTFDPGDEDPAVYRFDHEAFDEESDEPRSWIRLAPSLSSFLGALEPEAVPKREAPGAAPGAQLALGFVPRAVRFADGWLLAASDRAAKVFERRGGEWIERSSVALERCYLVDAALDGEDWALVAYEGWALASRRSGDAWSEPARVPLTGTRAQSVAVGSGLLAVGTEDAVELFERTEEGWRPLATLSGPGFGSAVAVDRSTLLLGHDGGMSAFDRTGGGLDPIALPSLDLRIPGHWSRRITRVAIGEGWLFGADPRDDLHLRDGEITGQRRRESGAIYALRRAADGRWEAPALLKREPAGEDDRLGRLLCWGGGLLLATTSHRTLGRQTAIGFALDGDGRWTQVFEGADVEGPERDDAVAIGAATIATRGAEQLLVSAVSPGAPMRPPASPVPRTVLRPDPDAKNQLGLGLGEGIAAGGRWAVTSTRGEAVVYELPEDAPARLAARIPNDHGYLTRVRWAVAGEGFVYSAHKTTGVWVGTLTREGQGWTEGAHLYAGPDQNRLDHLAADGDLAVFLTNPDHRAPHTLHVWKRGSDGGWTELLKSDLGVEVRGIAVDGARGLIAWCSSHIGSAAVCELGPDGLVELGRFGPAKPAASFGQAIALSRGEPVVGSAVGAHVFSRSGQGFAETALLKLARRKYDWTDDAVLASDELIVATSSTKGRGKLNEGALVAWARDPKKGWRKQAEIPGVMTGIMGYHGHGRVALAGRHALLGFPWRFDGRGCVEDLLLPGT